MQLWRVCLSVCLVVGVQALAGGGEYQPASPGDTGSMAQFVVPQPPKETAPAGGRDESKDPSRWIMNLAVTKIPPSKRYRRPTTMAPKALAQGATEAYDMDSFGLSVSPE